MESTKEPEKNERTKGGEIKNKNRLEFIVAGEWWIHTQWQIVMAQTG